VITLEDAEIELHERVGACTWDPLKFVKYAFPWGMPGPLEAYAGPDVWQTDFLTWLGQETRARKFNRKDPVAPIRAAVSSGHGIGKSVMTSWLILWIMSTRPYCQGTVTANTHSQLQTKTWATLRTWAQRCLTGHWFEITADRMFRIGYKDSWFCAPQNSKEQNSEAFAGQHAATSSSFYIIDEASAIPAKILEVAEGGLTDGEPMIFQFGNPTRTDGHFFESVFGKLRHRWTPVIVDSRNSAFTNKAQIAEWAKDHGEDSDFFRVRVRGLHPNASDLQFIASSLVWDAQKREAFSLPDDPLVCGLDVARGGSDHCVFRFRKGADARSIPPIRVPGEESRDSTRLITLAADVLGRSFGGAKVHTLFVDGTGIGGPITDRLKQMGHKNVVDVQFGAHAPDPKMANMRAYMWGRMREWLRHGAIDSNPVLETDLTGPGYFHDKQDRLLLESKEQMKKRGLDSPDDADALALTFAAPVRIAPVPTIEANALYPRGSAGWMGL